MNFRNAICVCFLVLGSASVFAQCNFPAPVSASVLNYAFEPIVAQEKMSLRITLEFMSGRSGRTTLILPSEWAGQKETYKSVTELSAVSQGTVVTETNDPAKREVTSAPNTTVRITYLLVKDWSGPLDTDTRFRADLSSQYFHIVGITSLVHPKMDSFKLVEVHFDWSKLPKEWSLATSFATDEHCQLFHGSWHDALNSLFVGGDYRIYHKTIAGNPLIFAIRGKWSFTDDEWTGKVGKIIEFERTFWNDNHFPYFLVTLTPHGGNPGSSGGTALTNAFMEHLSDQASISSVILGQIAHEEFHSWNPFRIGHMPDPQEPVTWFSEGFTRYYQTLILLQAALLPFPEYVDSFNTNLRNYELSEARDIPLAAFVRRHVADKSALAGLEYQRGAVIAAWLDTTIRHDSHGQFSLNDLMFYLARQNADYQSKHDRSRIVSNKRIFKAASKYAHRASIRRLRQYVEHGGSVQLPESALGPCVQVRTEMFGSFDLGFDRSSITGDTNRVTGVKPGTEAYKAGLRDGQQLLGWSFSNGDPSKQVRLAIKTDAGRQVLTYYPQSAGRTPVQQFVLDANEYSMKPEVCSAAVQSHSWLAGTN